MKKESFYLKEWFDLIFLGGEKKFGLDPLLVFGKMYAECPDYDASKSMADLFLEDGTYSGPETGKKNALKNMISWNLNTPSKISWDFFL